MSRKEGTRIGCQCCNSNVTVLLFSCVGGMGAAREPVDEALVRPLCREVRLRRSKRALAPAAVDYDRGVPRIDRSTASHIKLSRSPLLPAPSRKASARCSTHRSSPRVPYNGQPALAGFQEFLLRRYDEAESFLRNQINLSGRPLRRTLNWTRYP